MKSLISITVLLSLLWTFNVNVYADSNYISSYERIQWGTRGNDTFYCLDICDENWNVYPGLQALECGEGLHSWSPKQFLNELGVSDEDVVGLTFNWRVWSPNGYGGEGFEGQVIVSKEQPLCQGADYLSTYESIQWGCRGSDTFYCVDIFDSNWNMFYQAITCGEGLHSYSPKELDFLSGTYYWKVWSQSGYGENGFWGQFAFVDKFLDLIITAKATPQAGTSPLKISFSCAVESGNAPYTFTWDFGDGSTKSNEQNPIHTYQLAGKHTATIFVADVSGQTRSSSILINVSANNENKITCCDCKWTCNFRNQYGSGISTSTSKIMNYNGAFSSCSVECYKEATKKPSDCISNIQIISAQSCQ